MEMQNVVTILTNTGTLLIRKPLSNLVKTNDSYQLLCILSVSWYMNIVLRNSIKHLECQEINVTDNKECNILQVNNIFNRVYNM